MRGRNLPRGRQLYRMYKSYGFMTYDVYVIPSNIQVTGVDTGR